MTRRLTRLLLGLGLAGATLSASERSAVPGSTAPTAPQAPVVAPAEQRLYQPGRTLIAPEHARTVLEAFRKTYAALGEPRLVIYVNRELVDTRGTPRPGERRERLGTTTTHTTSTHPLPPAGGAPSVQVTVGDTTGASPALPPGPGETRSETRTVEADQTYRARETTAPTLADRQTMRDIERLFGRPLRAGGARLADPRVVAALLQDQLLDDFLALGREGERREREALREAADVVIEVLISSRQVTLPSWAGDDTRLVPDLQVTAIRLADGAILAQAAATDILGRDRDMGPIVRHFEVRDIVEATALALMEDFTLSPPRPVTAP
jgi:hypothetical protein